MDIERSAGTGLVGGRGLRQSEIGGVVLDLQVDQLHRVTAAPRRLCDKLETERFEPQRYPRIVERARMDVEKPNRDSLLS